MADAVDNYPIASTIARHAKQVLSTMSATIQSIHDDSKNPIRHDWTTDEIHAYYAMPFNELLFKAASQQSCPRNMITNKKKHIFLLLASSREVQNL